MIKEEKKIDFYTTGRQPSEQEFTKISEWIKDDKAKKDVHKTKMFVKISTPPKKSIAASKADAAQHQQP